MEVLTQFISQGILGTLFLVTLWCEVSNKYKDCLTAILFRLLVMTTSVVVFFKIYDLLNGVEPLSQLFIILLVIVISYVICSSILPNQRKVEINVK